MGDLGVEKLVSYYPKVNRNFRRRCSKKRVNQIFISGILTKKGQQKCPSVPVASFRQRALLWSADHTFSKRPPSPPKKNRRLHPPVASITAGCPYPAPMSLHCPVRMLAVVLTCTELPVLHCTITCLFRTDLHLLALLSNLL